MSRPTKISIDLSALLHNQSVARACAKGAKMICCVKANAYGHGIEEIASRLALGADALAVASIEEAAALRKAGICIPILLLEGIFERSELELVSELDLWMVVHNEQQLDYLTVFNDTFDTGRGSTKAPIDVWLKIDTGMHRLGVEPEKAAEFHRQLQLLDVVGEVRLMTHFACADELENPFTQIQLDRFTAVASLLDAECSLANSAALLAWPETHGHWVRPGYMLYGQSPFGQEHDCADELKPVMSFESQVIDLKNVAAGEGIGYNHSWRAQRDTKIAILALGYGDGYPRNSKNGAPVLIAGKRAKTVGHIAMDMMMVDVSELDSVQIGDPVELWGKHLSVNEVASYSGYSPYELLTRIPPRVRRTFID